MSAGILCILLIVIVPELGIKFKTHYILVEWIKENPISFPSKTDAIPWNSSNPSSLPLPSTYSRLSTSSQCTWISAEATHHSPPPPWAPPTRPPTDDPTKTQISWGQQTPVSTLYTVLGMKTKLLSGRSLSVQPHLTPFSPEFQSSVPWFQPVPFCFRVSALTSLCCVQHSSPLFLTFSYSRLLSSKHHFLRFLLYKPTKPTALYRAFTSVCNHVIINCCAF